MLGVIQALLLSGRAHLWPSWSASVTRVIRGGFCMMVWGEGGGRGISVGGSFYEDSVPDSATACGKLWRMLRRA